MKGLFFLLVISLTCIIHGTPRQLMAIDNNHNVVGMVFAEQSGARGWEEHQRPDK